MIQDLKAKKPPPCKRVFDPVVGKLYRLRASEYGGFSLWSEENILTKATCSSFDSVFCWIDSNEIVLYLGVLKGRQFYRVGYGEYFGLVRQQHASFHEPRI